MEIVLTISTIISLAAAAYFFASAREKQIRLDVQDNLLKDCRHDLIHWQNKALPSPLGFETRVRVPKEKTEVELSPVPKIPTRQELISRREKANLPKTPEYKTLAEKAKQVINEMQADVENQNGVRNDK